MLVKAVAPVLIVLAALATPTPASADPVVSDPGACRRVYVSQPPLEQEPGVLVCRPGS